MTGIVESHLGVDRDQETETAVLSAQEKEGWASESGGSRGDIWG